MQRRRLRKRMALIRPRVRPPRQECGESIKRRGDRQALRRAFENGMQLTTTLKMARHIKLYNH